jgi:hypothetical protein
MVCHFGGFVDCRVLDLRHDFYCDGSFKKAGVPHRLLQQGLLSCELLKIPAAHSSKASTLLHLCLLYGKDSPRNPEKRGRDDI